MSEQAQTTQATATQYRCDNCGSTDAPTLPMEEIRDLAQRLDIGGVVPAGQCGHCGALTYWVGGPRPELEAKMSEQSKKILTEFAGKWLYDHEDEHEDDTDCFYALSRAIEANPKLPHIPLPELRQIYDAEKEQ